jgi:uncharacterized membrane protein
MRNTQPILLIVIGFFLVLTGWVLPFLMVLHVIKSTFFLNFFAYAASLAGLLMGMIGTAMYFRGRGRPK